MSAPQILIVLPDSPRHWARPDLGGDVTNAADFDVDLSRYEQGQPLDLPAFRFEVLNTELDGLDWLVHESMGSLLVVSTEFLDTAQEAFGHALESMSVTLERGGQPFRTRKRYVVLQLGPPRPFFDAERSDAVMRRTFDGREVIAYVKTYALTLPEQVPPLFRLSVSPHAPTFASADFLERARRNALTNIAWMAAGSPSPTNQSRPL